MKLLYTERSPYARKARIIALEKKIPLELVQENLADRSPVLFTSNPLGKIPVLITDTGEAIYDSWVICEYLDQYDGKPQFMVQGADRWRVQTLASCADGLMDVLIALMAETMGHADQLNEKFVERQKEAAKRTLMHFEQHLHQLQAFNLASLNVACALGYFKFRFADLWASFPVQKLKAWHDEMEKRESFRKTCPKG